MTTSDNKRFLRHWFEVESGRIGFSMTSREQLFCSACRWVPYNKGGSFRKWYGNQQYVICFSEADYHVLKNLGNHCPSEQLYFLPSISWGRIASTDVAYRYYPAGFVFDSAVNCAFGGSLEWKLGLLMYSNTSFVQTMSRVLNPTVNFQPGDYAKLPYAQKAWAPEAVSRAERLIDLAREDWNSRELSWDFTTLPLLREEYRRATLAETYAALRAHWQGMTQETALLEEENNRVFNELYELGDEFPSAVPLEQITLACNPVYRYGAGKRAAEYEALLCADSMRELISYAVGCMFGRYSFMTPGLVHAGGDWDASRYSGFCPVADNIISVRDEDDSPNDLCARFVDFMRQVFGDEALEENLRFIAEALGGKGAAREVIRSYFFRDFYAEHLRAYSKRPIYWQFDSGKRGGFRALVYLHRYNADTLALMRTGYVFLQQERYRSAMAELQQRSAAAKGRERVTLNAQLRKVSGKYAEISVFEQQLHHLANSRISLDLDAGVVANYARFYPVVTKIR